MHFSLRNQPFLGFFLNDFTAKIKYEVYYHLSKVRNLTKQNAMQMKWFLKYIENNEDGREKKASQIQTISWTLLKE